MIRECGEDHNDRMPFRLFIVADSAAPVRVSGGMQIIPHHTVDTAPQPRVPVVPA